tara:strand:+ start:177 stop:1301 length:1125 start_codon:yes stop_codon:yes gene_type:complete
MANDNGPKLSETFNAQKFTDNPQGGPVREGVRKNEKGEITSAGQLRARSFVKASDAYANHKNMVINFVHMPSKQSVSFKAFITQFSDVYNSDWAAETVYGRIDPIYLFKNTTRDISLGFKVPAESESEAFENLGRVQKLLQFLYPNYTNLIDPVTKKPDIFAQTISQSPMVRLKVMNLLQAEASNTIVSPPADGDRSAKYYLTDKGADASPGLLGVIQNVNVSHNLEGADGVFNEGVGVVLPKLIEVSITFRPIHEGPVGWSESQPYNRLFPYGVNLDESYADADAGAAERAKQEAEKAAKIAALQAKQDNFAAQQDALGIAASAGGSLTADFPDTTTDKQPLQEVHEGLQSTMEQMNATVENLYSSLGFTSKK